MARSRLITPHNNIIWGEGYQRVAEIEIENFEIYSDAFEKIEFYNLNNNFKKINNPGFDYKYLTYKDTTRDVYEEVCEGKLANNTPICEYKKTGTEIIQTEEWSCRKNNNRNLLS